MIRGMSHHTGAAHWRASALQPRQNKPGLPGHSTLVHAHSCMRLFLKRKVRKLKEGESNLPVQPPRSHVHTSDFTSSSYLGSPARGGQVRQTAAGHGPKPLPAPLPRFLLCLFFLPPSLSKPGERQARGHRGD